MNPCKLIKQFPLLKYKFMIYRKRVDNMYTINLLYEKVYFLSRLLNFK